jgi:hypothetical protein
MMSLAPSCVPVRCVLMLPASRGAVRSVVAKAKRFVAKAEVSPAPLVVAGSGQLARCAAAIAPLPPSGVRVT